VRSELRAAGLTSPLGAGPDSPGAGGGGDFCRCRPVGRQIVVSGRGRGGGRAACGFDRVAGGVGEGRVALRGGGAGRGGGRAACGF